MLDELTIMEIIYGQKRTRDQQCFWLSESRTDSEGVAQPEPAARLIVGNGKKLITFLPTYSYFVTLSKSWYELSVGLCLVG